MLAMPFEGAHSPHRMLGLVALVICLATATSARTQAQPQAPTPSKSPAPTATPTAAPAAEAAAEAPPVAPPTAAPTATAAAPVSAPALSIPDAVRAFVATRRDVLGRACAAIEIVTIAELHYVACAASGMWVVRLSADGSANVIAVQDLGGDVVGFFEQGGELWARVMTQRATPILGIAPGSVQMSAPVPYAATPSAASPSAPPDAKDAAKPRRTWGTVLQSSSGSVVVDLGSNHGVRHGTHVAFYLVESEALGGFEQVPRKRRIAVGVVDTVSADRSRVALGVAEHVDRGTRAELTSDPISASSVAPPRVGDVWEYGFLARPFLVLDDVGVGAVIDAHLGYRSADDCWGLNFASSASSIVQDVNPSGIDDK
jgi:hypothetical protein